MAYTPYLIADYSTGIDRALQPWLSPDDSQQDLFDGYVYKGVMNKREGYVGYATGQRGGAPYCESRIVNRISVEQARTDGGVLVTGDDTPGPYVFQIQNDPVRRGTVTITAGAQSATDDGVGGFVTSPAGGSGTIDYTTGDVSITFLNNVAAGTQLTVTYDYHPGLSVMGIMTFIDVNNLKKLIVADTKFINLYDANTNRLESLNATKTITGITAATPGVVTTSGDHNLQTGDRIMIYGVAGMNEVNNQEYTVTVLTGTTFSIVDTSGFSAYSSGGTAELIYSGTSSDFWSWVNYPDKDDNPRLIFTNNVNQVQYYAPSNTPAVGDYVHYPTAAAPDFTMETSAATPAAVTTFTALQVFIQQDRLIFLRTAENGTIRPQRVRISGTGVNCDNFLDATGAGFIDVNDQTWIFGAAFNRADLLIFTESSTFAMKYSGNDTKPFEVYKIDESRGSAAAFSAITYLNRTTAASPRGLIFTDGYRVERADEKIPEYSFNEIDGENFELCFAGAVDADRDHYLIHPRPNESASSRILTTNYEEDNYAVYRLPLSCMGTFQISFDITWDDLLIYNTWAEFAAAYGDWNSFAYSAGAPISLGGGHKGEIWRLNSIETEDNPQKIRNITIIDANTIEVTTDWNNYSLNETDQEKGADYIYLEGISGAIELNNKQYPIVSVTDNYTFQLSVPNTASISAYTSGGTAQRVIPFSALFKKFNPFIQQGQKVRCGWIYFYVTSTGTDLTRNVAISNATQANPCVVTTTLDHNFKTGDEITIIGVSGMTELNDNAYFITVIDENNFSLDGVDSTGFGAYVSGGYATKEVNASIDIDIITNDLSERIQINNPSPEPLQCNSTNLIFEDGFKKWYKTYINQTAEFIQFRVKNRQSGAKIAIQATMPGFMPSGRLIR